METKKEQTAIPAEIEPPSIEQLSTIEAAKTAGTIYDYFLTTDGITKVVMPYRRTQVPWWKFLEATCDDK